MSEGRRITGKEAARRRREDRLAEALRANLRRRKAAPAGPQAEETAAKPSGHKPAAPRS